MRKTFLAVALLGVLVVAGCGGPTTKNIDTENDMGGAVMGLDYRDFETAAETMVRSLLQSGRLSKDDGSRYVVATGRIKNDTTQQIDTDLLMGKVERDIMNSGLVVMTSAVGGQGASDEMVYQVRDLKEGDRSDEFNAGTMPKKGQIVLPQLSLSGKIIQRTVSVNRNTQQVEYHFQLQLTEIASGLRYWQDEKMVGKRGSSKSPAW